VDDSVDVEYIFAVSQGLVYGQLQVGHVKAQSEGVLLLNRVFELKIGQVLILRFVAIPHWESDARILQLLWVEVGSCVSELGTIEHGSPVALQHHVQVVSRVLLRAGFVDHVWE
jgi:hypothetical protein